MRKKQDIYLDQEAMKLGFQRMLVDLKSQLDNGTHPESIKAILKDRKTHVEVRLKELAEVAK